MHGGQETTILALNNTLYHWGMLIFPLGYTVHEVFAPAATRTARSYISGHNVTGPGRTGTRRRALPGAAADPVRGA